MDESGRIGAFHRLRHQLVERFERHPRIVELHEHADRLPERRHGPAAQHGNGDQPAHRQLSILDQVDAGNDQQDIDELRDGHRAVVCAGREQAHLGAGARQKSRRTLPLVLDDAFRALRLDRF